MLVHSESTHAVKKRRRGNSLQRLSWLLSGDDGMSTAEYAIGTLAAAAFASVLYAVVTSDAVTAALASLVQRALQVGF